VHQPGIPLLVGKADDIPTEQVSRLEFVVNMKTAKTLGLTIPQSILSRADELIE